MYLPSSYLFSYTSAYIYETCLVTKVKPNIYSVEVHPGLCNMGHPVDGAWVRAGALWPLSGGIMGLRGWG
jgi:hypothetical protein